MPSWLFHEALFFVFNCASCGVALLFRDDTFL
jgi:hypothetical protein